MGDKSKMEIVVKRKALFNLLKNTLNEDAAARSDMFLQPQNMVDFEEENPIEAAPHMSLQLSEEEPPVADPEFVPGSTRELSLASMVIMKEVPGNQIEFVYRFLHKLLDMALDREEDEQGLGTTDISSKLNESQSRAEALIQQAARKYAQGESYQAMLSDISDISDMDVDDIEDKIADAAIMLMSDQKSEVPQPAKPAAAPPTTSRRINTKRGTVIRRRKEPEEIESVPSETEVEDLSYSDRANYEKSDNKESFMKGYNVGADDAVKEVSKEDVSAFGTDFETGYEAGYNEFATETRVTDAQPIDLGEEELDNRTSQRSQFSENVPHVLRLIPEFYMLCQDIGYKIELDRYNLMMTGDDPKAADKNIRQVYGIAHVETFINHNLLKSYFTKDYAKRSATKHLSVILDGRYTTPAATRFKKGLISALTSDDMNEEEGTALLLKVFVQKIMDDVANYNYEPDKNKKLEITLRNEFASTTVYKTGPAAGPGGSKKASAKPYQGNTSATFHRRVKEEYRQDIIEDYLDRLTNKYMSGDMYRIPSGRKDVDNPKRNERYDFDPVEFKEKAEKYANDSIDRALKDQEAVAQGKIIAPEDEAIDDDILGDEPSPRDMSDEEIAEKLSNTTDFQTLAPFFGFSGAPGMRQWFLKFAKRFFEMGLISAKSGDRTLIKFHSEMVEAVLETLSEKLPDMMINIANDDDGTDKYKELMSVLQRMTPQIEDAYQEFLDVGDNLTDMSVEFKASDGSTSQMPFLNTLGGQLARSINGMLFKKVLTRLDKAWTDYVAEQLQTNEQLQNYIAERIEQSAEIDAKSAKSIAEYFIGKKNAPVIVFNKKTNQHVYKSEALGTPTKGVKALTKFGIDANAYQIIEAESKDYFEDMLMTDFARIMSDGEMFEGQYREIIIKEYEKMKKNDANFKKVVLAALDDVITGSSQRMAYAKLSDYEVEK